MCIMVLQKVAQVEVKRKSDTQGGLRRNGFARVTDRVISTQYYSSIALRISRITEVI